jgi:hypothetical protein
MWELFGGREKIPQTPKGAFVTCCISDACISVTGWYFGMVLV